MIDATGQASAPHEVSAPHRNDAATAPSGGPAELPIMSEGVVVSEGRAPAAEPEGHAIQAWHYRGGQEPRVVDLGTLPGLVADDANFVWIDMSAYTEGDLRHLAGLLSLEPAAIRATAASWHRPRLVTFPQHCYVSATIPRLDTSRRRIEAGELDLFIGHNFLVSAHKRPLPFAADLHDRADTSPQLLTLDAAYMLFLVLDELLVDYEDLHSHLQADIQLLEERALHDPSEAFLEDLVAFKRYAFALARLADQHREVFAAFLRPDFRWVAGQEVETYFRDLDGRLARLLDQLLAARDAVNGAFDLYVSHMTHRTNQVIKLLTMVSTMLLPASLVAGIFGVSLASSVKQLPVATPAGFAAMLVVMLALSTGILWIFHRRGWL